VINLSASEEDDIEEQLLSKLLTVADGELKCQKSTKMMKKWPMRKVDGSEFFGSDFDQIYRKRGL
jgi:hypothetical protein